MASSLGKFVSLAGQINRTPAATAAPVLPRARVAAAAAAFPVRTFSVPEIEKRGARAVSLVVRHILSQRASHSHPTRGAAG
jgi:hypothetical protein